MDLRFWKVLMVAFFVIVLTASECGTMNTPPQPIADAGGNLTVTVGERVTLDGSGSSGDIVSHTWKLEQRPEGSTATLENADAAQASFVPDRAGEYRVSLTVSDGQRSNADSVVITATSPTANQRPVADAGLDQEVVASLESEVTLDGSGSFDPDDDTLSYSWAFVSTPDESAATLQNASSVSPSFIADLSGNYEVELTVSDGQLEARDTVMVQAICPEPIEIPGDINGDETWGMNIRNCADYLVTGRGFIFGNLTIQSGTHVVFESDTALENRSGSIQAVGTAEDPIVLTGANPLAGYWRGVGFNVNNPLNELSHVIVDGAGSGRLLSGVVDDAGVAVGGNARVTITNTTIRNSAGYGLRVVGADANISGFANNRFEGNAEAPLQLHANHLGAIDGETLYDVPENPNGNRYIEVSQAGRISSEQSWSNPGIPIRFLSRTGDAGRTLLEARVVIEAGTELEFAANTGLNVATGGALTAKGGELVPIVFRGTEGTRGNWVGLIFNTSDNRNVLEHVLVSDGGQSANIGGSQANIRVQSGGRLELRNSTIRNSEGCGLYRHPSGTVVPDPDAEDADNTFEDNAEVDIC